MIPRLGEAALQDLTAGQISRLYADLLADGVSPASVRTVHSRLRTALRDAVRWHLVPRNPTHDADTPPAPRRPLRTWTAEELASFLEATAEHRHSVVWHVAAYTGLRRSELLGLRWSDVATNEATLTVRNAVRDSADGYALEEGAKTVRSSRTIHLDRGTVALLRGHRAAQLEQRLALGPNWEDHGLVFTDEFGHWISPNALSMAWRRAVAGASVPRIRFHDVRHTHATLLLRAGVSPKVVSERLGHASVAFTLDTYAHVMPGMQPEAAEMFAALVGPVVCDPSATHEKGGGVRR